MPDQQQHKVQGEHGSSGQHRQHLHNPTGYTDEVADEEREFMMQAERSAGSGEQNVKSQKGGLGSQQDSGTGSKIGQQASSTMQNIKDKAKDAMNME